MKKNSTAQRFTADALTDFTAQVLTAAGLPPADAATAAERILQADTLGSDSHGIFRLKQYVDGICRDDINPNPNINIETETSATALVNGDNGLGHLTMNVATEVAIKKAAANGAAWVGVNYGNLAGPGASRVRDMLAHNTIGIYGAVGGNNLVPPWGGTERLLGSKPIAIAVPGGDEPPIALDMATTVALNASIQLLAGQGAALPEGWMVEKEGAPLTDPTQAKDGFLLPIGDFKGSGLALMVGLLGGLLNGAALGRNVAKGPPYIGQFIVAVSIKAFSGVDAFKRNVDVVARNMRGSGKMPGVEDVRVPGDIAHTKQQDRQANGIPITGNLYEELSKLASDYGTMSLKLCVL